MHIAIGVYSYLPPSSPTWGHLTLSWGHHVKAVTCNAPSVALPLTPVFSLLLLASCFLALCLATAFHALCFTLLSSLHRVLSLLGTVLVIVFTVVPLNLQCRPCGLDRHSWHVVYPRVVWRPLLSGWPWEGSLWNIWVDWARTSGEWGPAICVLTDFLFNFFVTNVL